MNSGSKIITERITDLKAERKAGLLVFLHLSRITALRYWEFIHAKLLEQKNYFLLQTHKIEDQ